MRAPLLHALRDPPRDGRRVRRVPRAGVLLRKPGGAASAHSVGASNKTRQSSARSAKDWWKSYFDAGYLREYEPLFQLERDRHEVARLVEILGLPSGSRVLDVPCGQGRHAHLLAEYGFDVDGLDYSRDLLAKAKERGTGTRLRYTRGDMRTLPARWTNRFDGVVNLFTSFGFFAEPADDARVIAEFARVLKPGGVFVFHGGSRDGVMARFLGKDWWETSDGTLVAHERSFDSLSGVLTIRSRWRGTRVDERREHRIRLYTATRLAELCAAEGLIVEQAWDGWNERPLARRSTEMVLVARKEGGRAQASHRLLRRSRAG